MAVEVDIDELKEQFEELGIDDFNAFLLGEYDNDGQVVFIEQDGGYEGGAESCASIFKFNDKFYRVTYSYYSHHGFEFDYAKAYEVTPVDRVTTYYE